MEIFSGALQQVRQASRRRRDKERLYRELAEYRSPSERAELVAVFARHDRVGGGPTPHLVGAEGSRHIRPHHLGS